MSIARRSTTLVKLSLAAVSLTLLSGCFERHRSTESLCEKYPEICESTNLNDGQCRLQRTNLIWQRYDVQKNPVAEEKFKELKFTYDYQKCLEYAARIEPTELKERKTLRTRALINSYKSIARLSEELAKSDDPEIIYYRWSQGEKGALRQFLQLEGTPALETPELQLALATYYTDKDKAKTIQLLKHALELYERGQIIKPEIIQSLATLSHQTESITNAYLWARVGTELGASVVSQEKLISFYPMPDDERQAIDLQAQKISKALEKGNFRASMAN
ncbi:hypothetical protein BIT28_10145 [Photobacterium proteolyticum]|uniref:DUF2989 domain-containing protein n=1 Tax=Photobacterium proteolyticum TaxID=1903952 RepID=A0A1Q9GL64_9GAMM|nr:DUF2989 domain-containing protein [Photobacterium proteolyticum]OLQ75283.1 hypothetical protein BIT28_10145 [Photobacterium proteolyticum]